MRTFIKEELKLILDRHVKWLNNETGGERANLSSANLSSADLSSANLSSADLSSADLSFADLSSANLRLANLRLANLRFANLRSANLSSADLSSANLSSADLSSADLLVFQFNRHQALFTFDGMIRIGCHYLEIKEWVTKFKPIGKKEGYAKEEIDAYGTFIKLCAKLQRTRTKERKAKNGQFTF